MSRSFRAFGVALGAAALLGSTGCKSDASDDLVAWAAEACACEDKACAETSNEDLAEIQEEHAVVLIDTRMRAAENLGAECLASFGVEADRRFNAAAARKPSRSAAPPR
jgi:hypothetical protein